MAATEDFWIKFGSNADTFAKDLEKQLRPAKEQIRGLRTMLKDLDDRAAATSGKVTSAFAGAAGRDLARDPNTRPPQAPRTGGGGSDLGGRVGAQVDQLMRDLASVGDEMKSLATLMGGIARAMDGIAPAITKQQKAINQSAAAVENLVTGKTVQYQATIPGVGNRFIKAKEVADYEAQGIEVKRVKRKAGADDPPRMPAGGDSTTPSGNLTLSLAPDSMVHLTPATIAALTRSEVDSSGFDRMVGAVGEVKAAIERLHGAVAGGVTITNAPTEPAPTSTTAPTAGTASAKPPASITNVTPAQAAEAKKQRAAAKSQAAPAAAALDADVSKIEQMLAGANRALASMIESSSQQRRELLAALEASGRAVTTEMQAAFDADDAAIQKMRSQVAALERKATGVTRKEQREARREEYRAGSQAKEERLAGLTREEHDRRKLALQTHIPMTADEQSFRDVAGRRGKQGMGADELKEILRSFQMAGLDAPFTTKSTKPEMIETALKARRQYVTQYGPGEVPEGLETGARPRASIAISENVIRLLGELKSATVGAERLAAAWEVMARNASSGGDVVRRVVEAVGDEDDVVWGSDASPGMQNVPRGPVKGRRGFGAAIVDESEVINAELEIKKNRESTQAWGLARAIKLSRDPEINPFEKGLYDQIQGPRYDDAGVLTEAGAAKLRLGSLGKGYEELDEIAAEFAAIQRLIESYEDDLTAVRQRAEGLKRDPSGANIGKSGYLSQVEHDLATTSDPMTGLIARLGVDRLKEEREKLFLDRTINELDESGQPVRREVPGLRQTLETPEFWQGHESRAATYAARQAAAMDASLIERDAIPRFLNPRLQRDAMGQSIVGLRTAVGSRDLERNIPGLDYRDGTGGKPGRFQIQQGWEHRDPASVEGLNKNFAGFEKARRELEDLVAKLDDADFVIDDEFETKLNAAMHKAENKGTAFLNSLDTLFSGMAPRIQELLSRVDAETGATVPWSPMQDKTIKEQDRRDQNRAEMLAAGAPQGGPKDWEEVAASQAGRYAQTLQKLERLRSEGAPNKEIRQTEGVLAAQRDRLAEFFTASLRSGVTKAENELQELIGGIDKSGTLETDEKRNARLARQAEIDAEIDAKTKAHGEALARSAPSSSYEVTKAPAKHERPGSPLVRHHPGRFVLESDAGTFIQSSGREQWKQSLKTWTAARLDEFMETIGSTVRAKTNKAGEVTNIDALVKEATGWEYRQKPVGEVTPEGDLIRYDANDPRTQQTVGQMFADRQAREEEIEKLRKRRYVTEIPEAATDEQRSAIGVARDAVHEARQKFDAANTNMDATIGDVVAKAAKTFGATAEAVDELQERITKLGTHLVAAEAELHQRQTPAFRQGLKKTAPKVSAVAEIGDEEVARLRRIGELEDAATQTPKATQIFEGLEDALFHGTAVEGGLPADLLPRSMADMQRGNMAGSGFYLTNLLSQGQGYDKTGLYRALGTKSGKTHKIFDMEQTLTDDDKSAVAGKIPEWLSAQGVDPSIWGNQIRDVQDAIKSFGVKGTPEEARSTWTDLMERLEGWKVGGGEIQPNITDYLMEEKGADALKLKGGRGGSAEHDVVVSLRPEDLIVGRVDSETGELPAAAANQELETLRRQQAEHEARIRESQGERVQQLAAELPGETVEQNHARIAELKEVIARLRGELDRLHVSAGTLAADAQRGVREAKSGDLTDVQKAQRVARLREERVGLQAGPHTAGEIKKLRGAHDVEGSIAYLEKAQRTARGQLTRLGKPENAGPENDARRQEWAAKEAAASKQLAAAKEALATAEAAKQRLAEIREELTGMGVGRRGRAAAEAAETEAAEKGPTVTRSRAAAAAQSGDMEGIQAAIDDAVKIRRRMTELRAVIKDTKSTAEEKLAARAERDQLRAAGIPTKAELKAMRGQLAGAGAGAGGGGDLPPTGGAGGASGGGGGRGPNYTSILTQILGAVKGVDATLKAGIKINGGKLTVSKDGAVAPTAAPKAPTTPKEPKAPSGDRMTPEQRTRRDQYLADARAKRDELTSVKTQQADLKIAKEKIKLAEQQAQAAQAASNADVEQARAATSLAAAHKAVGKEAQRELDILEKLTIEGKDAVAIANQQARAYNAVHSSLTKQNVPMADQRRVQKQVLGGAMGRNVKTDELAGIEQAASAARGFGPIVQREAAAGVSPGGLFGENSPFTQAFFSGHGFWSRMMASTGTFIVRNFAAGFVFGMTNALQQVMAQAIETEATFIRVSAALEATGKSSGTLRTDLQAISTDYGTALNDVYEVAAGLTGLFDNAADLAAGTRVVAQLETISRGALSAKEAMGALASIMGAYRSELGQGVGAAQNVADVLTSVQNNLGVNLEIAAEGVGRMSGMAQEMQISFEETAVFTSQIAKMTNQTGAAAGEQFSRIIAAMKTGRGRGALVSALGDDTDIARQLSTGDYGGALRSLVQGWDGLTEAQQKNISTSIGGLRQAAALAALLSDSEKTMHALTAAENSQGDAAERMTKISETLQVQLKKVAANAQNLASNLVRSGVLDFLGLLLRGANKALGGINALLSTVNTFAESNPLTKFFRDAIFAAMGLAAAVMLISRLMGGLKASMLGSTAVQRFRDGVNEGRTQPAAAGGRVFRTWEPVARPGLREYGNPAGRGTGRVTGGARVTRLAGFGLDRALGVPLQAAGRAINTWGNSLNTSTKRIGEETVARSRVTQRLGAGVAGLGTVVSGVGATGRAFLQGPAGLRDLSGRLSANSAYYREGATALRQAQGAQQASPFRLRAVDPSAPTSGRFAGFTQGLQVSALNNLARANSFAASTLNKVAGGMGAIGRAGIGADMAVMGLVIALGLMLKSARENAAYAKQAQAIYDERYAVDEAGKKKKSAGEEFGQATEIYEEDIRGSLDKRTGSTWDTGIKTIGGWLNGRGADETFGAEDGWQYGLREVQDIATKYEEKMASFGTTQATVAMIEQQFAREMAQYATEVEQDESVSGAQYAAALSSIEKGNAYMKAAADRQLGTIEAFNDGVILAADQVANINKYVDVAKTLGGRGTIEGINLAPLFESMLEDIGVEEGTELSKSLRAMTSGNATTVDVLMSHRDSLRDSLEGALVEWQRLRDYDPEGAAQYYADVVGPTIQGYTQASGEVVQTLAQTAQTQADMFVRAGDYAGALDALSGKALKMASDFDTKVADLGIGYGAEWERLQDEHEIAMADYNVALYETMKQEKLYKEYVVWRAEQLRHLGLTEKDLVEDQDALASFDSWQQSFLPPQFQSLVSQDSEGKRVIQIPERPEKPQLTAPSITFDPDVGLSPEDETLLSEAVAENEAQMAPVLQMMAEVALMEVRARIAAEIAAAATPAIAAALQAELADIEASFYSDLAAGRVPTVDGEKVNLPKGVVEDYGHVFAPQSTVDQKKADAVSAAKQRREADEAEREAARATELASIAPSNALAVANKQYSNAVASQEFAKNEYGKNSIQYQQATQQMIAAQWQITSATGAIAVANANLAGAYATARGDAVAAAQAGAAAARATLATAREMSGGARTAEVINAEAQLVAANAAIGDSQLALIQSRTQVSIALAEAAGHTVKAARLQIKMAQQALAHALKESGGENTAEVNQARAGAIQARAAARDARLQDQLDTIDFNLQMGKITQSSAISALQEILRTQNLTKAQRRQLMLQIKGMKDELSGSPWNFGDIKLPTPYQMRRYVEQHRKGLAKQSKVIADAQLEAGGGASRAARQGIEGGGGGSTSTSTVTNQYTFEIDGADTGMVRKIIEDVVGRPGRVRTTASRRR